MRQNTCIPGFIRVEHSEMLRVLEAKERTATQALANA